MSEVRTPNEVIADLAPAYKSWKSSEKKKEKFRKEFFPSITAFLEENEEQAEKVVTVVAEGPDEAKALAEKANPFWIADETQQTVEPGTYDVIIVENPEFQPFTIEYDGQVWGRQIASGPQLLDDDRMMEEDIDLYMSITKYAGEDLIREIIAYTIDEEPDSLEVYEVLEMFCEHRREGKRVLKPLEELDPETLAKVQPYMYEGQPSVKLPAPKKADG